MALSLQIGDATCGGYAKDGGDGMNRRPKDKTGAQRFPIQARVPADLRDKLAAAAEASGRSIAQEMEARLAKSLDGSEELMTKLLKYVDDLDRLFSKNVDLMEKSAEALIESCGGDELFTLWRMPSEHIQRIEERTGKSIREDVETRREAERAVLGSITDVFRKLPPPLSQTTRGERLLFGGAAHLLKDQE
jgi:hypothetical protein